MANLSRYEPWNLLEQLNNEVHRAFGSRYPLAANGEASVSTADWVPAVDVKEEADRYVIHADVPGVEPKDIHVTMERGMLNIKGERHSQTKTEREGYKRVERSRGSFFRSFSLPESVDAEAITAKGRNGVLEIVIPKTSKEQTRKISVEG